MTRQIRFSQNVTKNMHPDLCSMETSDLCVLYDAALSLDDAAIAWSNMPRLQTESEAFPGCVDYTPAGETVVAWSTFYSDVRDAIAEELQQRPITDQTFMVLVQHFARYRDDPADFVNIAAGLLGRIDVVAQAAE
ncbi:hypothetical protein [Hwanghaeella sp.]|uniref:hypothetical protein n=1 Tax=Hwanghaeella sp. TaxID=2605943 RepID=UPI003CCC0F8F